ncbi:RNA polymerase sigma-70 factor [Labilithrix luteola]|uniref:RNA polymerase sigma-70 factor n=1 Tax=Labilithrix luteola TaxID=1391654 RepID=A0A0K1PR37_9BACT|nr:sigma-70 family RNA polymerase sigma factor [Labilithrix luteola]AKU95987.1 RNA polymerase sigma-70 factor [Labilithrix luteola]
MTAPNEPPPPSVSHGQGDACETDEALVARLGSGDEEALRSLHQRYAALVFTVAARFVDAATAEEVVQDVFVTLWKKHATFDPARGAFKSWIIQITRHRSLNELRRRRGHDGQRGQRDQRDEPLEELSDDAIEPDEAQWLAHRRDVIRAAVEALPAAQRQALSLAFFDELTHEQIATVLRTPVGTTKTRIRLGLKRLAPVLVVALAATALLLVLRRREESAAQNQQALRMVTASDVVPLRLEATPAVPPEAHGNYRTRPGANVAVLTTNHLPPLVAPDSYVVWAHGASGWRLLGPVVVERDGRSLLVIAIDPGAPPPDELRVTRESGPPKDQPLGPVVLAWPGARQ